jgi:hypothetical protein
MQKVNPSLLYGVGKHLAWVSDLKAGDVVGRLLKQILEASTMLGMCEIPHNGVPLTLCISKAKALSSRFDQLAAGNPSYVIAETEVDYIKSQLHRFEGALQAELADSPMFFVPPRGIYNTTTLIDKAETVFSQEILDRLPQESIADLRQSGRALAFDLPTASGFHGCRAAEAVIKKQVLLFSGSPAPSSNWGDYVRLLKLHGAMVEFPIQYTG